MPSYLFNAAHTDLCIVLVHSFILVVCTALCLLHTTAASSVKDVLALPENETKWVCFCCLQVIGNMP